MDYFYCYLFTHLYFFTCLILLFFKDKLLKILNFPFNHSKLKIMPLTLCSNSKKSEVEFIKKKRKKSEVELLQALDSNLVINI